MPLNRVQLQSNFSTAESPATYVVDTTSFPQLSAISSTQGLVLITSNRFDNVTSVSINNCFTSLYQNYRVLLTLTNVNTDSDFTLRFRSGGIDNVSSFYNSIFMGIGATAGAASNATASSGTSILMGESDNNAGESLPRKLIRYKFVLDILSPAESETTSVFGFYNFVTKAVTDDILRVGGSSYQHITPFDGFSFISSSALSISGIVRVYGYRI
jgi:hypothetical protein